MSQLADGLKRALEGDGPIVVYSDVSRFRLWEGSREATLDAHLDAILEAAGDRVVVFPTFNYDWCQTGTYDPRTDPSQVGVLSERFRTERATYRTLTPIFNFGVRATDGSFVPSRMPALDPFGPTSTFQWLIQYGATVLVYGAPPRTASAVHVAERERASPYRYAKAFPGAIAGFGSHVLIYLVRPVGLFYDWTSVESIVRSQTEEHSLPIGTVRVGRADQIHAALLSALDRDEHAFLAEPPTELYMRCGKPLRRAMVEALA